MNSDGQYKWWLDGVLIYEEANLRLAETNDAAHKINGYWMASFHGPNEGAAVNDCFLYLGFCFGIVVVICI